MVWIAVRARLYVHTRPCPPTLWSTQTDERNVTLLRKPRPAHLQSAKLSHITLELDNHDFWGGGRGHGNVRAFGVSATVVLPAPPFELLYCPKVKSRSHTYCTVERCLRLRPRHKCTVYRPFRWRQAREAAGNDMYCSKDSGGWDHAESALCISGLWPLTARPVGTLPAPSAPCHATSTCGTCDSPASNARQGLAVDS